MIRQKSNSRGPAGGSRSHREWTEELAKAGFQYCGIIHLLDGDERLAYQKIINSQFKFLKSLTCISELVIVLFNR